MATKQWVNLPNADESIDRSKMTGDGIDSEEVMGQYVYIKATLDKKDAAALVKLTVIPDAGNAEYVADDSNTLKHQESATATVSSDGEAKWKVKLSQAGGDKFKFEVECNGEKKTLSEEFETHRRLYYQVIDMDTITGLADLSFWETEFKKNNRNIHLHATCSKGNMGHSYNFDYKSSEYSRLFNLAKAQYDTQKDPYCFALVWADCLAQGPKRKEYDKDGVSKGGSVDINIPAGQLWKNVDKSSTADPWLLNVAFIYTKDGTERTFPVPEADLTSTYTKVTVSTENFPDGVTGKIKLAVNVAEGFHGGWSFPTKNIIVIATRGWYDTAFADDKKKAILIHEAGHKIGQVPNGSAELKKQSTHDDAHTKHCNDTACTMWYTTKYKKATYCSVCDKSVRKQYLHHSIAGLKRFY
ncbi:MAG TPA: hypothetical protein ENK06_03275 [Gammaproteobacteria bacterium]|nr:hypothetical protein [Gammaproteobacteria bacterium]